MTFDGRIATERLLATIAGFFGVMALLLIAVGVYGTAAYAVAQRTREFGIRLALGATAGRLIASVVGSAMFPVSIGIAIGLPLALLMARSAEFALFGISSRDPLTFAGSVGTLVMVAILAALLPARRAARTDSASALRAE